MKVVTLLGSVQVGLSVAILEFKKWGATAGPRKT